MINRTFGIVGMVRMIELSKKCPKCKAFIQKEVREVMHSKAIRTLGGKVQKLARS